MRNFSKQELAKPGTQNWYYEFFYLEASLCQISIRSDCPAKTQLISSREPLDSDSTVMRDPYLGCGKSSSNRRLSISLTLVLESGIIIVMPVVIPSGLNA